MHKLGFEVEGYKPFKPKKIINKNDYNRARIRLKDGTFLAYNEPMYKIVILSSIPIEDFFLLKEGLKDFVTLDLKKLKSFRNRKIKDVPFLYNLTEENLPKFVLYKVLNI